MSIADYGFAIWETFYVTALSTAFALVLGTAAERVADQNCIRAVAVECAIGLIGHGDRAQCSAALKTKRLVFGKGEGLGGDDTDGVAFAHVSSGES